MQFTLEQLQIATGIEVIPVWVKAGVFSHRHPKDKADPIQIQRRQEYLDRVPNGEWLLVMDSDEILLGGLGMIAQVLEWANNPAEYYIDQDRVDVICISEILPDLTIVNRPRFIKKREGLKYGGPNNKHDYIEYNDPNHQHGLIERPFEEHCQMCLGQINYINPKIDNPYMWTMEGVFFWHNKNGALKIYKDDEGQEMKAFNLVSVRHIDKPKERKEQEDAQYDLWREQPDQVERYGKPPNKQDDKYDMYKEIVRD